MSFGLIALFLGLGWFGLMLTASDLGWRVGARLARGSGGWAKGAGSAEAAMFALFGLLVAFTFSGAAARFEDRRHLIADETNAIGTAYLRLDLLPSDTQPAVRELFRRYLDTRYQVYRGGRSTTLERSSRRRRLCKRRSGIRCRPRFNDRARLRRRRR